MRKAIGIFAHVDAGKTTLSEQILYNTGSIRSKGRVDNKNTVMDTNRVERERGITIFSDVASFEYKGSEYYIVDTPGHVDFCAETERALSVIDYAVLVVSAVEGIQGQTVTLWKLLEEYGVPVFIFVNKTDRAGARTDEIISEMKKMFSPDIISAENIIEKTAENDENLLEMYIDGRFEEETWRKTAAELIKNRKMFLCLAGSALNNDGVDELLECIENYTYTDYSQNDVFSARAFKVRYDSKGGRNVFIKILSGTLAPRDKIEDSRIFEIRTCMGAKYKTVEIAEAGMICAVTGLNEVRPGDIIGAEKSKPEFHAASALMSKVIYPENVSANDMLKNLKMLEDEEPLLKVEWEKNTKEIRVHVMGAVQLEVLKEIIFDRFNINVEFGRCEAVYMETVGAPVVGSGHFEPLRHYAEVHLRISPGKRGTGIVFESACPFDVLDRNYQNVIRTHVYEKVHKGVLTGSPLTDVKITLMTGRAHLKHTEGGDFREAVYRAVRHGLCYSEKILLEPLYNCVITVPQEETGRILSDIQKMSGNFEAPQNENGFVTVRAKIPVSEAMDYPKELQNVTKGRGQISMAFGGYEQCHNTEEVTEKIGYDMERDIENTADSVFCSHGSGFNVKWNEAKKYMHCMPE